MGIYRPVHLVWNQGIDLKETYVHSELRNDYQIADLTLSALLINTFNVYNVFL